jgi:hypothetical protein
MREFDMDSTCTRIPVSAKIRTIGFLVAMIPMAMVVGLLGVLMLALTSPVIVYARIFGKHIKDPWRGSGIFPQ